MMFSKINEENKKQKYVKVENYQASRKMTGNSVVETGFASPWQRHALARCLKSA